MVSRLRSQPESDARIRSARSLRFQATSLLPIASASRGNRFAENLVAPDEFSSEYFYKSPMIWTVESRLLLRRRRSRTEPNSIQFSSVAEFEIHSATQSPSSSLHNEGRLSFTPRPFSLSPLSSPLSLSLSSPCAPGETLDLSPSGDRRRIRSPFARRGSPWFFRSGTCF